jgi:hypothetical protein
VESKFWIESFTWNCLGFVKIEHLPSLISSIMSVPYNNCLSFNIFSTWDIKCFSVTPVDEVFRFVLEDLPPVRVSGPDLHVVGLSWGFDIPWLAVVLGLDCQWFLVEPPDLSISTIWCLEYHVSVVDQVEVSVRWQCCDNVEWSFNIEAEVKHKVTTISHKWDGRRPIRHNNGRSILSPRQSKTSTGRTTAWKSHQVVMPTNSKSVELSHQDIGNSSDTRVLSLSTRKER